MLYSKGDYVRTDLGNGVIVLDKSGIRDNYIMYDYLVRLDRTKDCYFNEQQDMVQNGNCRYFKQQDVVELICEAY